MDESEMKLGFEEAYKKCTIRRHRKGRYGVSDEYVIKCKKGLWAIYAPCGQEELAEADAIHYFAQYYEAGEYEEDEAKKLQKMQDMLKRIRT